MGHVSSLRLITDLHGGFMKMPCGSKILSAFIPFRFRIHHSFKFPDNPLENHSRILEFKYSNLTSLLIQPLPNKKRVAVIDSIISNPGMLLPWREMVQTCKDEGVWSAIDAAHSISQKSIWIWKKITPGSRQWVSVSLLCLKTSRCRQMILL